MANAYRKIFQIKQSSAAQRLKESYPRVLKVWEDKIRRCIPATKSMGATYLFDSIPDLIDSIVRLLETSHPDNLSDSKEQAQAYSHGKERSEFEAYDIEQVALEYQILRQVIFEVLREDGPLTDRETDIILNVIDTGIRNASSQFVKQRQAALTKLNQALRSASISLAYRTREYEAIFSSIPDPVIFANAQREIVSCNSAVTKCFGYSSEELIGQKTLVLYENPSDYLKTGKHQYNPQSALTGIASYFIRYRKKSGEVFISDTHSSVIRNDSGEVIGYLAIIRDVTERIKNEETQRQLARVRNELLTLETNLHKEAESARQELFDFFMQAPVALCVLMGPDYRIALTNPTYVEITGRNPIGKTVRESFSEGEAGYFILQLNGVYQTGIPYVGKEILFPREDKNGKISEVFLNISYYPFRESDGKIKGILVVSQDVTELVAARKQIEKSAKEIEIQKEKFELIFSNSPVSLALLRGPDLVFEIVNASFRKMLGNREFVGKTLQEGLPELVGLPFQDYIRQVYRTGKTHQEHEVKAAVIRQEGGELEERYFDVIYMRIDDGKGNNYGILSHGIDVTDRVMARKRIEESEYRFRKLAHENKITLECLVEEREIRERFVATLAHDLRVPLSTAQLNVEILVRKKGDPKIVQETANRILNNIERLDQMIRDLLDVSRIKAGEKLPIEPVPCELKEILEATVGNLTSLHGNRFVIQTSKKTSGVLDVRGVQRIIENLCSNAVKYGDPNTPITLELMQSDDQVILTVHNWGNPIPLKEQKELFDPYRRADSALKGKQKGWGLGLTLVRGLVEAHGGRVEVESSKEKGTLFKVILPLNLKI